ncbi:hypothetical protein [Acetobacter orleanensis]|uniref:Uncharacterized protein n=1 Tax=Acetobacter orleanensis TaxID=104099 RepID=A0A4Y3TP78_9PROT|nr:hypothetical protein [Acetobacter orleanensis]KXV62584.1 hypothetical protein AD949_10790 [Acetobacter orleanensis]PCD79969.1 hypothetical protein CO710_03675 [Acetobacter orleanensis]GAN68280.1 hypothetical protein Abol_015_119 [Acetobacter orleanensis JCM 7639]GBR31149.1 hypothetical protein AA0473_2460 [Acetobacter orleanensis NRIC 0473]GEB82827.1 hypothetical protein AOR01nite_13040 [Acetobacter orleanensis]
MSRTIETGLAGASSLHANTKKRQKQQAVLRRCGLLALVCALCFLTAHLVMLLTRHLPFEDVRLRTDLGGMVIAALLPCLVLAGFAGLRYRWGLMLCLGACAAAALTTALPL